jgi:O-antigen ligase
LDILTQLFLGLLIFGITFSNAIVEICIAFIILIFLIKRFLLKETKPPQTPINLILYIFCIIIFISFLRSAYYKESIRGIVRIIKYTLLYFSVVDFLSNDERRLGRFFWTIIYIAGFTFLNGIFQEFFGFDILRHRRIITADYLHRISASFVHPNDFGAYIISVLPLTSSFISRNISKRKKIILALICLLGLYCLVRTSSRGAWLGFLCGIILYFFFYKRQVSILIPIILILLIVISPHGLNRIASIFSLEKNTVWERVQLWAGTWNMVKEHPLLGFGINTFSDYFPKYKPVDYPDLRYTHNSYLQMWSEIGIIGLLVFLFIIFTIIGRVLHNLKNKVKAGFHGLILLGLLSGYIAFLIQSGLDTNLYSLVLVTLFWLMNAYLVALNKQIEQ